MRNGRGLGSMIDAARRGLFELDSRIRAWLGLPPRPPRATEPSVRVLRDRGERVNVGGEGLDELLGLVDGFLNSNWAFGLTLTGARRRRLFFTVLGAVLWAYSAYRSVPFTWDIASGLVLLTYILRVLLDVRVTAIIIVLALLFRLILYVLALRVEPSRRAFLRIISLGSAVVLGSIWGLLARQLTQVDISPEFARAFVAYPFEALFAPSVLRTVLVAGLAFWLAFRVATTYLDDIYELNDFSAAERFILQAAFASQYNKIQIKAGEVAQESKKSPIFLIGGPGLVQVHLDSAALFESVDGEPRVIGPTQNGGANVETLAGYERLRQALDIRDQIEEKFTIDGRTRDGLRISLKDVNVVYSIYRAGQASTLVQPYPFDPEAVLKLVYNQGPNPLVPAMRALIRREFVSFISKHRMNEFLASIGPGEVERGQAREAALQDQAEHFSGLDLPEPALGTTIPPFYSRPDMMTELFAEEFAQKANERGVDIHWIGGGTWEPHDKIVLDKHQEAWRLSRQNLVRSTDRAMDGLRMESRIVESLRLVQEVPIRIYQNGVKNPASNLMRSLLIAYRGLLNQAYEYHQRSQHDPAQLAWLRRVLAYLTYFTARWVGGP